MAGKRKHALRGNLSGPVGERRVGLELARCGLYVATPYWDLSGADLIVVDGRADNTRPVVIPIQVKSIQFLGKQKTIIAKGLHKQYVEKNKLLCLALYRPDTDQIWFVPGADRIRKLHEAQRTLFSQRTAYSDIAETSSDDKVRTTLQISLNIDDGLGRDSDGNDLDAEYLVPSDDAAPLGTCIFDLAKEAVARDWDVFALSLMWKRDETDEPKQNTGEDAKSI